MGQTRASRQAAMERAARVGAAARALSPEDRHLLNLEHMLPGPHGDAVGITVEEYARRVRRLCADPDAITYAETVIRRLRVDYGVPPGPTRSDTP